MSNKTTLAPSPIYWTNTQIFKLIEMFKDREILWNYSLDEYKDRSKKYDAWCEIATEFNFDKQTVEKKMKSLIGQFQRELKKFKSNNAKDNVSKWFAFKKLLFLLDQYKLGTSSDSGCEERYGDVEREQGEDNEDVDSIENVSNFATPFVTTVRKRLRPRPRPRPKHDHTNTSTSEAVSLLLQDIYQTRQHRDEFDVFGEHVAMKLRKLKHCHAKNTAQFHINNILYNADMGDYDWPSNERWNDRPSQTSVASRTANEDYNLRQDITPRTSFVPESSNDGSVSTIEDVKYEIDEN